MDYAEQTAQQMLLEQVALFSMNYSEAYQGFEGGQLEWAHTLIQQAELFCIEHVCTDWSEVDWYSTSDDWMDSYINEQV